jgi:pyridoxine 4-dehydrogenase
VSDDLDAPAAAAGTFTIGGDLTINRMGFGAMRITGRGIWGPPKDVAGCRAVLRRALDLGVDLIDTADSYGPRVSEELIAETLHPYPEGLVIATKGGLLRDGPGRWRADCSPEHLRAAVDGSLGRLRLDRIDVYQLHTVDRKVPYEDSIGALAELQKEGKIRHIGVSNVSLERLGKARELVEVVTVQNRFNITDRRSEVVLHECEKLGIGFLPWAPLSAGGLAAPGGSLDAVAEEHDATGAQISLAWLIHRSNAMLPIPGTSSVRNLEENVAAAGISLTDEDLRRIEAEAA